MAGRSPLDENNNIILGEEKIPGQYQDIGTDEHKIGENDFQPSEIPTDDVEIENNISPVASAPAKNILILIVLVVVSIIFLYKFVFKESDKTIADKQLKAQIEAQPVASAKPATPQDEVPKVNIGVVDTPELPTIDNTPSLPPIPTIPDLPLAPQTPVPQPEKAKVPESPVAPLTPAPQEPIKIEEPAAEPVTNVPQTQQEAPQPTGPSPEELRAHEIAKRKTGMIVMNGGGTPRDILSGKADPTAAGKSSAAQTTATKVDDLSLMIVQGKMIDAVLETTLNTDLPGSLRAIINRDIYAESGKNILIPRGSRLIGTYNSGIQPGQQRVIVTWGRVIRPDGVDIDIASQGTDQLGRAGMTGIVDNKYFEMVSNSLLFSALTIGGTSLLEGVKKSGVVTKTDTTVAGSSQSSSSGSPTDSAVLQSVQDFGNVAKNIVKGAGTQPTIIVNQGARIKVFVNKDLVFPASVVNKTMTIN